MTILRSIVFQLLVGQDDELVADAEEAADRQHDERRLAVLADDDVVDLADRRSPASLTTDEPMTLLARKPVAHLHDVDLGELDGLAAFLGLHASGGAATAVAAATATVRNTRRMAEPLDRLCLFVQRRAVAVVPTSSFDRRS